MDKDISDMMSKFSDMMKDNNQTSQSNLEANKWATPGFDINTILKMKSIMDKMNSNADPRSNLLRSLKPYLNENRQSKVDQYINLFSMSKVMEAFKETGGGTK